MKLHHLKLILFLGLLTVSLVFGEVVDDTEPDTEEEKQDDFDYGDDVSVADDDEESISKEIDDNEVNVEIHNYESPTPDPNKFYFAEHFDEKTEFNKKWIKSQARKDDIAEEIAKYDGEWNVEEPKKHIWKNDLGLVLKSKAKHAAIASKLSKPYMFDSKPLTVQYEVTMQDGQVCGGSYLKLLSCKGTEDLTKFNDKTPYTIMFGPDKCGNDIKLHFIFRHVNPINGSITEKHCRKPRERLEEPFKDKLPHLYQLLLKPDNTFEIRVDHRIVNQGSLLNDFEPPVNPPKEINDPNDKKPDDWDEREKIPDPTASKPDDWDEDAPPQIPDPNAVKPADWLDDEEEMIPDPNAKKPDDWDTEMDGEWEPPLVENPVCENAVGCGKWKAPLVSNPDYKGKWRAPLIDNPNYQGKWLPKKIPNPDFFEDLHPFKMTPICAVGIEIWSMSNDIYFDNILITDDVVLADEWAEKTFDLKRKQIDKDADTFVSKLIKLTNDNPYMWGVYILVVGVPLAFVIYSLCRSKKDEKNAAAAKAKKTDEPSPDDDQSINENSNINKNLIDNDNNDNDDDSKTENKEEETEKNVKEKPSEDSINNLGINEKKSDDDDDIDDDGEPNNQNNTSPKSKKSDLEVENNENEINTSTTATKTNKNEDFFESNVENIGGETEEISSHVTEGARKRKPRKE